MSLEMPDTPSSPDWLIEELLDGAHPHPAVVEEVEDHAGVERAARVPMGRPSKAVNPIVLVTLRPASSAHMLAPLPRCSTTVSAGGRAFVELRQHRGDVLVREAVEAVAPDAGRVQLLGQRELCAKGGVRAVKRGVEARDLRQLGGAPQRRIGARLCGWCSGASGTNFSSTRHHAGIDRTGWE